MRNEDALEVDLNYGLAVLADGMGGLMAGREASRIVVQEVLTKLREAVDQQVDQQVDQENDVEPPRESGVSFEGLGEAIQAAHQQVLQASAAEEMKAQMGSTVVIWTVADGLWSAAHVGDSRLYRWHRNALEQLSTDHSLAQRMLDSGEVEPGVDVEAHYGHVLTQGLGLRQPIEPGFHGGDIVGVGERFLLCSDGLSDMVSQEKMSQALAREDLEDAADQLLGFALDMGAKDNISLILIEP
jgi:protein phosphatase